MAPFWCTRAFQTLAAPIVAYYGHPARAGSLVKEKLWVEKLIQLDFA